MINAFSKFLFVSGHLTLTVAYSNHQRFISYASDRALWEKESRKEHLMTVLCFFQAMLLFIFALILGGKLYTFGHKKYLFIVFLFEIVDLTFDFY